MMNLKNNPKNMSKLYMRLEKIVLKHPILAHLIVFILLPILVLIAVFILLIVIMYPISIILGWI